MQHIDNSWGININSWEEFEEHLQCLQNRRNRRLDQWVQHKTPAIKWLGQFLYRGQDNYTAKLQTTLERAGQDKLSLKKYYEIILRVEPQIKAFTGVKWKIPSYSEFEGWLERGKNDICRPGIQDFPAYNYMAYVRHYGFPSPLLDWTKSPYIAAYFAFRKSRDNLPGGEKVSVYVLWDSPSGGKTTLGGMGSNGMLYSEPCICRLGPYVKTHRRHFLQQSEYTICIARDKNEWYFASHEDAVARCGRCDEDNDVGRVQDFLWKFNIPYSERLKVLKLLDGYNINAFSLFGSEESLMETMALREIDFREL
jgi:hypothetical protein